MPDRRRDWPEKRFNDAGGDQNHRPGKPKSRCWKIGDAACWFQNT
jgi:hypothetical protein